MVYYAAKKFVRSTVHSAKGHVGHAAKHIAAHAVVNATGKYATKQVKRYIRKVKKIPEKVDLSGGHSGATTSTIKINENKAGLKLLKSHSKAGLWKYQQSYHNLITSPAGLQQYTLLSSVNTLPQCLTSTGAGFAYYQADTALEQLNPYLTNTGSVKLGSVFTPLNDRFIINNNSIMLELTNFEPVSAYITVYVLKAKKLSNQAPTDIMNSGYANMAYGQGQAGIANPGNFGVMSPSGYPVASIVGIKPNDSQVFQQFWKICTVKDIILSGASTEVLNIDIAISKVLKADDARQSMGEGMLFNNNSYVIMTCVRGGLVIDNTTSGQPQTTYGPTKVGVVTICKTTCSAVLGGNSNRLSTHIVNDTTPANALAANITLLNEVDLLTLPNIV